MGALAGTEKIPGVDSGTQYTTPADLKTYIQPYFQALFSSEIAFAVFDGTATSPITPSAGLGITSVTRNATGDFTVNPGFGGAPKVILGSCSGNYGSAYGKVCPNTIAGTVTESAPSGSSVRFATVTDGGGAFNPKYVYIFMLR